MLQNHQSFFKMIQSENYPVEFGKIPLRNKKREIVEYAIVSPEDYENVMESSPYKCADYVRVRYGDKYIGLSALIFCVYQGNTVPKGHIIDHINRNPFDNRRENLRLFTYAQNAANRTKVEGASSDYYGVHFAADRNKYCAGVSIRGKREHIGYFILEIDAAEAYDIYLLHCENSDELGQNYNFPDRKYELMFRDVHIKRIRKKNGPYIGVRTTVRGFSANVFYDGKDHYIGFNKNAEDCARRYDKYVMDNRIRKPINFIYDGYVPPEPLIKTIGEKVDDETMRLYIRNNDKCYVVIDINDYDSIKHANTCYLKSKKGYESIRITINRKSYALSRFLMEETDPDVFIDHINNNSLDYKRSNLRRTDTLGNANNRKKKGEGYNYIRRTKNGTFSAKVIYDGKTYMNTTYTDEINAVNAVNACIDKHLSHTTKKRIEIVPEGADDNDSPLKKQK